MPTSLIPTMTGNSSPAPYVAAASSTYTGRPAYRAFDKRTDTDWLTLNPSGWIRIDLGVAQTADSYRISAHTSNTAYLPRDWTLEGSSDAVSWTVLDTRSGLSWASGQVRDFTFAPSTFRFFRLNIAATNYSYCAVTEWDLFGTPAPAAFAASLVASGVVGANLKARRGVAQALSGESSVAASLSLAGLVNVSASLSAEAVLGADLSSRWAVGTSDVYANDGYNYGGLAAVDLDVPIAATPAGVRRVKVQRVHQSLPAPTLENGRPV